MNNITLILSTATTSVAMSIYYFTTFREETKNQDYSEFFVSIVLFLLLYIATFILIYNIIEVYKSYSKKNPIYNSTSSRRFREDVFARSLARRAPDPDNVINPLFDRSPQFLSGPFGPNNPRANQVAYTFFNV
jgi:hypothetical protein